MNPLPICMYAVLYLSLLFVILLQIQNYPHFCHAVKPPYKRNTVPIHHRHLRQTRASVQAILTPNRTLMFIRTPRAPARCFPTERTILAVYKTTMTMIFWKSCVMKIWISSELWCDVEWCLVSICVWKCFRTVPVLRKCSTSVKMEFKIDLPSIIHTFLLLNTLSVFEIKLLINSSSYNFGSKIDSYILLISNMTAF